MICVWLCMICIWFLFVLFDFERFWMCFNDLYEFVWLYDLCVMFVRCFLWFLNLFVWFVCMMLFDFKNGLCMLLHELYMLFVCFVYDFWMCFEWFCICKHFVLMIGVRCLFVYMIVWMICVWFVNVCCMFCLLFGICVWFVHDFWMCLYVFEWFVYDLFNVCVCFLHDF